MDDKKKKEEKLNQVVEKEVSDAYNSNDKTGPMAQAPVDEGGSGAEEEKKSNPPS